MTPICNEIEKPRGPHIISCSLGLLMIKNYGNNFYLVKKMHFGIFAITISDLSWYKTALITMTPICNEIEKPRGPHIISCLLGLLMLKNYAQNFFLVKKMHFDIFLVCDRI